MLSTSDNAIDSRSAMSANLVRWLCGLAAISLTWSFVHTQDPFFKVDPKYHLPELGPSRMQRFSRAADPRGSPKFGVDHWHLGRNYRGWLCVHFADQSRHWKHFIFGGFTGAAIGGIAGLAGCLMQYKLISQGMLAIDTLMHNLLWFDVWFVGQWTWHNSGWT